LRREPLRAPGNPVNPVPKSGHSSLRAPTVFEQNGTPDAESLRLIWEANIAEEWLDRLEWIPL